MIDEQIEFQIAQYADGTLPPADVVALERELAANADAAALLEEYRRLDASLKRELPVPAMNWDRLAAHLSDGVAAEDRATTTIAWPLRNWGKVAAAAAIFIVLGTTALMLLRPSPTRPGGTVVVNVNTPPPSPAPGPATTVVAVVVVTGPAAQTTDAAPVVEINVGPSQWAKQTGFGVADEVVYRAPRVTIASGQVDRQDTGRLPF